MYYRFANAAGVKLDCKKCKDYKPIQIHSAERIAAHLRENAEMIHDAESVPVVTERAETVHDAVEHPSHYCKGGVECLDAIKAALGDKYEGFLAGNVLKYVYRYPDKNGVEDCRKAAFYLNKLIEVLENG